MTMRIVRSRARPAEYVDSLKEAVENLRALREHLDTVEQNYHQAQTEVLTILAEAGVKSSTVTLQDGRYRVTHVANERIEVDETGLRKAISAPVFDKLCDLKLNRTKLEIAIAEGRVDPVVVASNSKRTTSKAYPKLSLVAGTEQ
jgi:hypothetical protein